MIGGTATERGGMPHLKCVACRIRLHSRRSQVGGVGEPCPGCGEPLEAVGRLSELVGFQASAPASYDVEHESDPATWLDDDGRSLPEAIAQAMAKTPSEPSS